MKQNKMYISHSDGGHAWLAVKRRELEFLNIIDKVSRFSYQKGGTVYLEEDCDAGLFIVAYEKKFGTRPLMRTSYRNVSPIRGYELFVK